MTAANLLVFALALVVAAGSPGPSITLGVVFTVIKFIGVAYLLYVAMWLGEALWLGCAVAGLAVVARTLGVVFTVIKFIGVAYLLYLAWKMWFAPTQVSQSELPKGQSRWRLFGAGLAVTLGNPKIMVFYLALLPTIVDLNGVGAAAWIELTAVTLFVLISVDFAWALLAVRARRLLTSRKAVKIANRTSATMMAGAAAVIAAH